MKIGIAGSIGSFGPEVPDIAKAIEELGFESVWIGEHIFLPVEIADPVRHGVRLPESYKHLPDPFIILAAAAAATKRLRLGTNICIVPQRNPLALAKEVSTLDFVSGGRFIFGIGVGWIEEEAKILGFPFKSKVKINNEYIRAMKVLWSEDEPSFSGDYISFPKVYSNPKPTQKPHPPILIGAGDADTNNSAILKRVAQTADGWLPLNLTPAQIRDNLRELREACDAEGRAFDAMDISLVLPASRLKVGGEAPVASQESRDVIADYEDAGVKRIVVIPAPLSKGASWRTSSLEALAKALGLNG